MGRPINKKYFGATGSASTPHIPVRFKSGGSVYEGYIVKQVGSRRFKCSNDAGSVVAICKTVDGSSTNFDPANNGECVLTGHQANSGIQQSIRRMTNHIAWDYSGKMHKWTLQDDSTETLIILVRP